MTCLKTADKTPVLVIQCIQNKTRRGMGDHQMNLIKTTKIRCAPNRNTLAAFISHRPLKFESETKIQGKSLNKQYATK